MKEITQFKYTGDEIQKTVYTVLSASEEHLDIIERGNGLLEMAPFSIRKQDIGRVKFSESGDSAAVFLQEDDSKKAKQLILDTIKTEYRKTLDMMMNFNKLASTRRKVLDDTCDHIDKCSLYPVRLRAFDAFNYGQQVKPYYLLKWNDEYLEIQIMGGPFADNEAAASAMKEEIMTRLVELNVADSEEEAREMYAEAEKDAEQESGELHIGQESASILFGGGYEERYQIVKYEPVQHSDVCGRNK